ncbi:MAG TPA: prepilin-type N-terminal cleavage/methylation domain-containing protein [Longimicrobiales bacterium]|nr:prepilin-type N-terminal cleavage/methylation domain-containing protein [Longimicrobiales bacterium]
MDRDNQGFTLIELLIVVVIIGILASIAIPKFSGVRDKAFVASVKADLRNLANLQDVYYNDNYTYTTSTTDLGYQPSEGVVVTIGEATNLGWSATGSHLGLASENCAIYHGNAAQVAPATTVSVVQCTT